MVNQADYLTHPKATKDYCPVVNQQGLHSFYDMSYWNGTNHPTCVMCGYVDDSRTITDEERVGPHER